MLFAQAACPSQVGRTLGSLSFLRDPGWFGHHPWHQPLSLPASKVAPAASALSSLVRTGHMIPPTAGVQGVRRRKMLGYRRCPGNSAGGPAVAGLRWLPGALCAAQEEGRRHRPADPGCFCTGSRSLWSLFLFLCSRDPQCELRGPHAEKHTPCVTHAHLECYLYKD